MVWKCLVVLLFCFVVAVKSMVTIRVMSWNVGDNKLMDKRISPIALRRVLGLDSHRHSQAAFFDIYAITLQENCFACNYGSWKKISDLILNELNKAGYHRYEHINHAMTRKSSSCEIFSCATRLHGTTNMFVFAKRGYLLPVADFRTNRCNKGSFSNAEKGIAAVKVQLRHSNTTLCFGGLHLDSNEPSERRKCFDKFYQNHGSNMKSCSMTFFAGDFNTRTGDKGGDEKSRALDNDEVKKLLAKDEMSGSVPYQGQKLIDHVSKVSGKKFGEGLPVTFYPTYSIKPRRECNDKSPCYRGNRPPSWTDRIICSPCNTFKYNALDLLYSDHFPVYGIYTLEV